MICHNSKLKKVEQLLDLGKIESGQVFTICKTRNRIQ